MLSYTRLFVWSPDDDLVIKQTIYWMVGWEALYFTTLMYMYALYRRLTIEIVVITQGLFAKYLDKAQSKLTC